MKVPFYDGISAKTANKRSIVKSFKISFSIVLKKRAEKVKKLWKFTGRRIVLLSSWTLIKAKKYDLAKHVLRFTQNISNEKSNNTKLVENVMHFCKEVNWIYLKLVRGVFWAFIKVNWKWKILRFLCIQSINDLVHWTRVYRLRQKLKEKSSIMFCDSWKTLSFSKTLINRRFTHVVGGVKMWMQHICLKINNYVTKLIINWFTLLNISKTMFCTFCCLCTCILYFLIRHKISFPLNFLSDWLDVKWVILYVYIAKKFRRHSV